MGREPDCEGRARWIVFARGIFRSRSESIIGTLRPPEYRSGIILGHDGESDFVLRNATTMDVCYRHTNMTSKVVACFTLVKQP
ncbi:hypothetical protein [Pseudorhodoplanes sp.]|uniref:hypothetical protein n=1 Tax=Pseudorhodoplanes sp. TaxID=1934341 RepID=UPI003D0EA5DF